jgi:hypothetical protein
MTTQHTVFKDMRQGAIAVVRVHTQASVYIIGLHEDRGRKYVVVRGLPGTDREHVIVRDSDPRVGEDSLFDVAPHDWIGQSLEIATMTSSTVVSVHVETDAAAIAAVGGDEASAKSPWQRPRANVEPPPGLAANPRIMPGLGRGTSPAFDPAAGGHAAAASGAHQMAQRLVVGQGSQAAAPPAAPELPYPKRHVRYAEDAALLLRSIHRRDRIFEDLLTERDLRDRLRRALDDCAELLEQIRRRDRR